MRVERAINLFIDFQIQNSGKKYGQKLPVVFG
jgi:hypothetical protein